MPVDYRCTAQHTIGSISGFFIEIGFHGSFGYHRLTCKIGFVYLQGNGFQQFTVSRDFLAGFQNNNIADHHILTGNFLYAPVTDNLYQCFLVHRIQQIELFIGIVFKKETDTRSQQDSSYDTDCFGILVLYYGDNQREESGHQQYSYYRVFKLFQIEFPQRRTLRGCQQVYTMLGTALPYFIVGKSDVIKIILCCSHANR